MKTHTPTHVFCWEYSCSESIAVVSLATANVCSFTNKFSRGFSSWWSRKRVPDTIRERTSIVSVLIKLKSLYRIPESSLWANKQCLQFSMLTNISNVRHSSRGTIYIEKSERYVQWEWNDMSSSNISIGFRCICHWNWQKSYPALVINIHYSFVINNIWR